MNDCPHDIHGIRDRLAAVEARQQDQRERHDRLETRLDAMQRAQEDHHRELMDAIGTLQQQQAEDQGARNESSRWWKRAGVIAAVVASLVTLGWIGDAESAPVAAVGAQKEIKPNRLEVE